MRLTGIVLSWDYRRVCVVSYSMWSFVFGLEQRFGRMRKLNHHVNVVGINTQSYARREDGTIVHYEYNEIFLFYRSRTPFFPSDPSIRPAHHRHQCVPDPPMPMPYHGIVQFQNPYPFVLTLP